MDCDGVRNSIFLFIDQEMEPDQAFRFESHLKGCPQCARRRDYTLRWLLLVRRRMVRVEAPPSLRRRLCQLLG